MLIYKRTARDMEIKQTPLHSQYYNYLLSKTENKYTANSMVYYEVDSMQIVP